jgi:hypothetical protein
MLEQLQRLYEAGCINAGTPECMFPETLIFNEGWLLRSVLKEWLNGSGVSGFGFLPFPKGVSAYSEGQLYTPLKPRWRGDELAEGHTHVDGIVGDFSIDDTKSGIVLSHDLSYVAVFEAKLFAPIASGVTNAPSYDQVSRIAGCLINSILLAERSRDYAAHLVVLYDKGNRRIDPNTYTRNYVEEQINKRVDGFLATEDPGDAVDAFARGWRKVLGQLQIHFHTWEDVLRQIGSGDLDHFYEQCKTFNQ